MLRSRIATPDLMPSDATIAVLIAVIAEYAELWTDVSTNMLISDKA